MEGGHREARRDRTGLELEPERHQIFKTFLSVHVEALLPLGIVRIGKSAVISSNTRDVAPIILSADVYVPHDPT